MSSSLKSQSGQAGNDGEDLEDGDDVVEDVITASGSVDGEWTEGEPLPLPLPPPLDRESLMLPEVFLFGQQDFL